MTTRSYGAIVRPLVLTVVWFAFLAAAAFAWAAIEDQRFSAPNAQSAVFVAR